MTDFVSGLNSATDVLRKQLDRVLAAFVESSGLGKPHPYRPEAHYMRGPGPKWHAKYGTANIRMVKLAAGAHGPARR